MRAIRAAIAAFPLFVLVALAGSGTSHAQANLFERLVMPGDVIAGHAKVEGDCKQCHEPFRKRTQDQLCTACHKDIARDVDAAQGFHGRSGNARRVECRHCHTDHKGRTADIVRLDPDTFDHAVTDYPLKGAHAKVECAKCHTAEKKHRDAPSQCVDCHSRQDRHKGALGRACAGCHDQQSWRGGRFDHASTRFVLVGRHQRAACASCHADERYKGTPTACADCHRLDDVHAGRFGRKCESCHGSDVWTRVAFDHDRQTRFALTGRHRQTACHGCHKTQAADAKPKQDCFSCHDKDDVHRGRNGPDCRACHATGGWREVRFNHDQDTKFPLRGRHSSVKCESCHRAEGRREKLDAACAACHKADDIHKDQLGTQCAGCHNESGWRSKVRFDHDLTRFPLIGQHATAPCEACHVAAAYKDAPKACIACHQRDDTHKARLGPNCALCHNPNGWELWRFDHNRQARFALDGAHARADCLACHRRPVELRISLPTACVDCHRTDDVHRGDFGLFCERCHVTESFRKVRQTR